MPKEGNVPWNKGLHLLGPMEGKKHTREAKEKMRQKKLGKPGNHKTQHSDGSIALMKKNRAGIPAWNRDLEMPQSFCDIMSKVQEGKTIPLDQREKISKSLEGREKSELHVQKVVEAFLKLKTGNGFWMGNIQYDHPRMQYCEKWKDVNFRVHAFFDYKCVECGKRERERSHIGHHVFYVKKTCCWYNEDGIYYTNLFAPDHKRQDYCIGENPNYFVILCSTCHGRTNGNFKNRKKWADHFKELIDTQYGGKCYLTKEEMAGIAPPG